LTQDEAPFLADLAGRWGVSRDTARSYARLEGFPAPLVLTARTIRWPAVEVAAWEDARRAAERPDIQAGRCRPRRGSHEYPGATP